MKVKCIMNNKTIAIIGAMDCEISEYKKIMDDVIEYSKGMFKIYKGKINNYDIILSKSGVGKVCACANTQFIIDNFKPDYIINSGVAGGIAQNLQVGDIVIATSLVQHDFDATVLGYAKGYTCNDINPHEPTIFKTDKNLIEKFKKAINTLNLDTNIHEGLIATGDMFIGTPEKKEELKKDFNAIAAEMESCAITAVAKFNNIPCLIIRAISDLADCTTNKPFIEVEHAMAQFAAKTTLALLKKSDL